MSKKTIISVFCLLFSVVLLNAQTNKIKLGEKVVTVKGSVFNETIYTTSTNQTKYVAYQFLDKTKRVLIITEIGYEFENGTYSAIILETYTCPLAKIDKQNSYNLEMEDEAVSGGKYWRLTLLSFGQGIDNLYFQKQTQSIYNNKIERKSVNNVTINILQQSSAEKWLRQFTK